MIKHLLYLHGFNSSPLSLKAQQSLTYFEQRYPLLDVQCPQLANEPKLAIEQIERIIAAFDNDWAVIGSSLGGFFSTYLSEKYKVPAVLINPAVKPYELLADLVGEQVNPYTHQAYRVEAHFMSELIQLRCDTITPTNYFLLLQMADEVLPYIEALKHYQGCQLLLEQGGNHSFVNFQNQLDDIAKFLQLT